MIHACAVCPNMHAYDMLSDMFMMYAMIHACAVCPKKNACFMICQET